MGMDLCSLQSKDFLCINGYTWCNLMALAFQYGWEPLGTDKPGLRGEIEEYWRDKDWDGGYSTNDSQVVKPEDARNIAKALELALIDMQKAQASEQSEVNDKSAENHILPFGLVERFIDFCQKGAFLIA